MAFAPMRWVRDAGVALWRGITHYPRAVVRRIRDDPSRAMAIAWIAGMLVFSWVTFRRAYRQHQIEQAREAEQPMIAKAPKAAPEVVQMMDIDEMEKIQADRFHSLGLAAAGEDHEPTPQEIDAARESRTKVIAAEGERVGGSDVVVVAKGGIAGWIKRNKNKKPDPETLAWLRHEEAAEGRAAYAEWADGGNSIEDWIERGKRRRAAGIKPAGPDGAVAEAMAGITNVNVMGATAALGSGAEGALDELSRQGSAAVGSAVGAAVAGGSTGGTSATAGTTGTTVGTTGTTGTTANAGTTGASSGTTGTVGSASTAGTFTGSATGGCVASSTTTCGPAAPPTAGTSSARSGGTAGGAATSGVPDVYLVGLAALAELDDQTRKRLGARQADADLVDATIRAKTIVKKVDVALRNHRVVITLPAAGMFGDDGDLTMHGNVVVGQVAKALATLADDFLITAPDPEHALAVGAAIAVAGVPEGRLAMGDNAGPSVEITVIPTGVTTK